MTDHPATPPTGGLELLDEEALSGLEEMVPSGHVHIGGKLAMQFIAHARAYLRLRGELAVMRVEMAKLADGTSPASVAYAAIHGALGDIMRRATVLAKPARGGR